MLKIKFSSYNAYKKGIKVKIVENLPTNNKYLYIQSLDQLFCLIKVDLKVIHEVLKDSADVVIGALSPVDVVVDRLHCQGHSIHNRCQLQFLRSVRENLKLFFVVVLSHISCDGCHHLGYCLETIPKTKKVFE